MFTGIIEATSEIIEARLGDDCLRIQVERPQDFNDISVGDSIACNGVCLTVEKVKKKSLRFAIGHETLKITGWERMDFVEKPLNLERSLVYGERIHGHLVSGHVDQMAELVEIEPQGESLVLKFSLPKELAQYVWKKSSVTVNGVSLTVNNVYPQSFDVCLIPETLKKTNLSSLAVGDRVTLETDYYMKGLLQAKENN